MRRPCATLRVRRDTILKELTMSRHKKHERKKELDRKRHRRKERLKERIKEAKQAKS